MIRADPIDPSKVIVDVEDYPHIDWTTADGKEQLSAVAIWFMHAHPDKWHVVFQEKGETIGEMIMQDLLGGASSLN